MAEHAVGLPIAQRFGVWKSQQFFLYVTNGLHVTIVVGNNVE